MAGVLFIVSVPCENYENVLSDQQIWETTTPVKDPRRSHQIESHGEIETVKDSKPSSLETFTESIETDSLNHEDPRKEVPETQMKRTKSAGDCSDEKIGETPRRRVLTDSDEYLRKQRIHDSVHENQEALNKFFEPDIDPILDSTTSMERVLREICDRFRIKNASWVRVNSGNSYQVTFSLESGVRCDDVIHMLSEFGIGQKEGSSVAVVPCTLYKESHRKKDDDETISSQSILKETAWNRFIGTVRARMNVAKTVAAVKADATLTFDFIVLLIVASILASFGLVENSTLFLAASMLVSPLMHPILAATFGAVIKDHKLQYWGMANELIGIFMCIFVGFIFGLITCGFDYSFGSDKALTQEMLMRTDMHSVIVGICIALPSGAAVAIAILGNNFGGLVGLAISASLLPPAVNTGLFWSFSFVHMIFKDHVPRFETFLTTKTYSTDESIELLALGSISLCVTLTNVLCIFVMGYIFLKVKEVVPASEDQRQFWKHDIKIARDYNKTLHADEGHKLQQEAAEFHGKMSDNFKGVGAELLKLNNYAHTNTWSPSQRHHHRRDHNTRTSLRELDSFYMSLSKNNANEKHHRHFTINRSSSPSHDNSSAVHDNSRSKNSHPICVSPKKHIIEYPLHASAPLEVITEMPNRIQHESTLVSIENQAGHSNAARRKFIVTPAREPIV